MAMYHVYATYKLHQMPNKGEVIYTDGFIQSDPGDLDINPGSYLKLKEYIAEHSGLKDGIDGEIINASEICIKSFTKIKDVS